MRRFTWVAAAAATAAIALPALASQPAVLAADKTLLVPVKAQCSRLVRPKCPKYYAPACTQHGRGVMARCCVRMGCVPRPW
jgi:hypothetical protein